MRLLRLFNDPAGRAVLMQQGVPEGVVDQLPLLGISSICNVLAAIKTARYFELDEHDLLFTSFTDSVELYQTRLTELVTKRGAYTPVQARVDFERYLLGATTDHIRELTFADRKQLHNLKYFTWVEQQGKSSEELDALWTPSFWHDLVGQLPRWDEAIAAFNRDTGALDHLKRTPATDTSTATR